MSLAVLRQRVTVSRRTDSTAASPRAPVLFQRRLPTIPIGHVYAHAQPDQTLQRHVLGLVSGARAMTSSLRCPTWLQSVPKLPKVDKPVAIPTGLSVTLRSSCRAAPRWRIRAGAAHLHLPMPAASPRAHDAGCLSCRLSTADVTCAFVLMPHRRCRKRRWWRPERQWW